MLDFKSKPNLVVCWGGHSIGTEEYQYTKKVGYELGLRGLDVCTGCGPGAMKGPMKGATIGHAKQRIVGGRYIGLTEPGIIAAEPPNPIVNQLVIMPDIEKRLEAFVRLAHGIVVFPGGVGTAEEILYLLGILLEPANAGQPLQGRAHRARNPRAEYFVQITRFIGGTLGEKAAELLHVIVDDPAEVARYMVGVHGGSARLPPRQQRLVQLQLAAEDPAGLPAPLRGHAREHARRCACTATCRRTSWRPTCGARSPASSPAT